jgi:hypothetical protein
MQALDSSRFGLVARGLVAGLLATACGGPTLGDLVEDEVSVTVLGVASAPDVAAIGDAQGGLAVSRAFVSTSALRLVACRAGAGDITLGARGYDLLQDPAPSERVTTAVSELCGLRVDIDPVSESAAEGIPTGASLYVEGQDAAGEAFTLVSESSASLLFEAESGSSFGEQPLLLGFDVSVWLAGLPLPEKLADMSAELFDSQLHDCAALYVDSNGNQALDDDEQTPVARAALSR